MQIGSRVEYIHDATLSDKYLICYPPIGTLGTVISIDAPPNNAALVRWDNGTNFPAEWHAPLTHIREINIKNNFRCKAPEKEGN